MQAKYEAAVREPFFNRGDATDEWLPDTPCAPFRQTRRAGPCVMRAAWFTRCVSGCAVCPHCGGTFCRECVTDEEGKTCCPPCLRRMDAAAAPKQSLDETLPAAPGGDSYDLAVWTGTLFLALLRGEWNTPEGHLDFDISPTPR